jgi:very-short-patch-repair endonuclease
MKRNFAEHPKSLFWSKKNLLKPEEVALNSHKKFLFDCLCGHEFESNLNNINALNNWCPYCANKKLCNDINCKKCFNNSFASHPRAIFWSDENILKPRQVFINADRKTYIFNCECGHKINMNVKSINRENHWCSYCSHQKLCEDNCNMCFNNSCASTDKSTIWSSKNNLLPRQVFKSSNKKYIFDCNRCNQDFTKIISDVTNGIGCPHCYNKTELIFYQKLQPIYSTLNRQSKFEWCKNIHHLPFDFVIEERKIIIEVDGPQHFKQVFNWKSPEDTHICDLIKMKCANENGYSMIRILQNDILKNKYDWLAEIIKNIELISADNRAQNIYMCKKDEYKDFTI